MRRQIVFVALLFTAAAVIGGCSLSKKSASSGGTPVTPPVAQTVVVTTYYDTARTQLATQGPVLVDAAGAPTTTKQGLWLFKYPPAQGNGKLYDRTFVNNTWDQAQFWREYNPDSSIRYDWRDR